MAVHSAARVVKNSNNTFDMRQDRPGSDRRGRHPEDVHLLRLWRCFEYPMCVLDRNSLDEFPCSIRVGTKRVLTCFVVSSFERMMRYLGRNLVSGTCSCIAYLNDEIAASSTSAVRLTSLARCAATAPHIDRPNTTIFLPGWSLRLSSYVAVASRYIPSSGGSPSGRPYPR